MSNQSNKYSRWELRCRFLVALAWIVGIGCMQTLFGIAVAGLCGVGLTLFAGVSPRRTLTRLRFVLPFLAVSFCTLLFSDGYPISSDAAAFATLAVARIIACLLVAALVLEDDVHEYLTGFHSLGLPDSLTSTLFLAQRYVQVFGRQLYATKNALASRLFAPKFRRKTMNVYGSVVGGLTIHAIDRSEHVRQAMESRGFNGRIRTKDAAPIRLRDFVQSTTALGFLAVILIAERWF